MQGLKLIYVSKSGPSQMKVYAKYDSTILGRAVIKGSK